MGLQDGATVKTLLAGFLLSILALVATTTLGLLAALSALSTPTGGPLLFVLLDAIAPYIVASAVLGVVSFFFIVALSVAALSRASMPRDDRLARLARRIERHSSEAASLGLSEHVEPTTEDRIEDLKEQYVAGEISELEYERRLENLLDESGVSEEVRREHSQTSRDREFEF